MRMGEGERGYTPTDSQLERRERLAGLVRQAMGHSDDLVAAVMLLHDAARVAVDVTQGRATDGDLKATAEQSLDRLAGYVNVQPMRRELRAVIDEIECELAAGVAPGYEMADGAEANEVPAGADAPRKERAG